MAKDRSKQSRRTPQVHLADAVREIATAICQEKQQEKRLEVGKHLMLLGNLAAGALLFGQVFSGFPFNLRVAVLGVIVLVLSYVGAWFLMKGGDR